MKEYNSAVFGSRLRAALKLEGMTQQQLADKAGISQGSISTWLSGAFAPTAKTLIKMAQVLNASADYLLGLSNNPRRR